jgi:long-chain acyl-CoA synthetase
VKLKNHLLDALHERSSELRDRPALWSLGRRHFEPLSWRQVAQRVRDLALGLRALGVERSDPVGVPEHATAEAWLARLAVLAVGAAYVSLNDEPSDQAAALKAAKARFAFTTSAEASQGKGPKKLTWLTLGGDPGDEASDAGLTLRGSQENEAAYWDLSRAIGPEDLAALVPGTAGLIKLSHKNLLWTAGKRAQAARLSEETTVWSEAFPPVSGSLSLWWTVPTGSEIFFVPRRQGTLRSLKELRPTVLEASAQFWKSLAAELTDELESLRSRFDWALKRARSVASEHQRRLEANERVSLTFLLQRDAAQLWLSGINRRVGMDRLRVAGTEVGGLAHDTLKFFASLGIVMGESWGVPEASGVVSLNAPDATRLGSAGRPLLGTELRVDADRKLWLRGENVAPGLADAKGWLALNARGTLDDDGYLWPERASGS